MAIDDSCSTSRGSAKMVSLHVYETRKTTGVYLYVVKFDADIWLLPDDLTVTVELVNPSVQAMAADSEESEALHYIREGIIAVLAPKGLGAVAQVSNLVIYPMDFIGQKYEQYTIRYLEKTLQAD